jgi:hypothetical protein
MVPLLEDKLQSYFTHSYRNPGEARRPSFCEIVVSLQRPDFQILKFSPTDESKYSKAAMTLGSPIEKGHGLYPELQRSYIRKGSADDSSCQHGATASKSCEALSRNCSGHPNNIDHDGPNNVLGGSSESYF